MVCCRPPPPTTGRSQLQTYRFRLYLPDGEPSESEKKTPTPRKNAYLRAVSSAKKGFQLCGTLPEAQTYRRELAFFDGVRAIITDNPTACNAEDRQLKLVKLLDQAVEAQGTVNLLELLNRDLPNLNLLSDEFLEMVKNAKPKTYG
nr:type I restriction enzyme endonuclease domain-containing protein [Pasteurella caecimuris]